MITMIVFLLLSSLFIISCGDSNESKNITELSNPPADGSSLKYELQQIVSDDEDTIGTNYEYELVELLDSTFTKDLDGKYYFLEQPFTCSTTVDCDTLVNLNNSGGLVNVTFEYSGNGKIVLTQWN